MENLNKYNLHFGNVRSIPADVEESRTIPFAISSEQRDRYATRLMLDRWELDNYQRNPVVGFNHPFFHYSPSVAFNPDYTIGVGNVTRDMDSRLLLGSITFEPESINPLAEKVFRKILHGTYKSTSVGFYETKAGDFGEGAEARGKENETYYYGGQELLEFSVVEIPANTDATIRRFLGDIEKNCPTFVARELDALRKHSQKGQKQAIEAGAEFIGNIEMELELMALANEI